MLSEQSFVKTISNLDSHTVEAGRLPARIAILVSDMRDELDLDLVRCIVSQAGCAGMRATVCEAAGSLAKERRILSELLESDIDGLVLSPVDCHQMPPQLRAARCPVVLVGQQYFEPLATTFVGIDNCATAQRTVEHLRDTGYEKIGFLAVSDQQYSTQQRIFGYRIALASPGVAEFPQIIITAGSDDTARKQIRNALSEKCLDAVICDSSSACYQLLLALDELPASVAAKLQVVTFSSSRWQRFSKFRIAAINQPSEQIASHALQSLTRRFQFAGRKSPHKNEIFLGAEIVGLASRADRIAGRAVPESARCIAL
jgi:LacI family transcriptional regulator